MSTDRAAASSNDAIDRFLEELTFHGKTERTRAAYERVLRRFEAFLADPAANPADRALPPDAAGRRECMAWIHTLRGDLEPSTVATYAAYLHRFYAYMTEVGEFDNNPMTVVREEMDERIDTDPTRREIAVPEMREFVARLTHPLDRALVVTLLKTGMRVGELCNLDLRDVTMTGNFGAYDLGGRAQLDGRGDSLYVASDIARGDAINGEDRTAANKRKRGTVVPVDDELAVVLREWLAIRPNAVSPAEPLFCSTGDEWGQRVTPSMVRSRVKDHAEAVGWYRTGGGPAENVTPHYFRHFFTTHLRDRTGDRGIVKYLRGDVADDIIDTYTHNWGTRVRDTYERHIYELL
ncbi:tyrosine-type recombinase/integrase [Halorientalis litorea]|uniref:tyrosine-type recombinase/integrase n=1 Tax=Halorientalis litorea TaxID=2931977 RepID=UPI001FF12A6C|nr:tyrosine-type recombinase/integrase [Halorientalis litorea]